MVRKCLAFLLSSLIALSLACSTLTGVLPDEAEELTGLNRDLGAAEQGPEPNPRNVQAELESDNTVSARSWPDEETELSVTSAEGTRFTLTMPPGAVLSPVELRMTPVSELSGLPDGVGSVQAVHLEPEGLALLMAATLTIETDLPADSSSAFATYAEGQEFHLSPSFDQGGSVQIPLMHFSEYGMLSADQGVIRDIRESNPPIEEAGRFTSQLASSLSISDVIQLSEEIDSIFLTWYLEIEPSLRVAQTDSTVIDRAVRKYLHWKSMFEAMEDLEFVAISISSAYELDDEAKEYLANGLWNAIEEAAQACDYGSDPDQAVRMLRWASVVDYLELWELDTESAIAQLRERNVLRELKFCMQFLIKMESEIIGQGEMGEFTHQTSALASVSIDEERFKIFSLKRGYLDLLSQDFTVRYENFSLVGSPVPCETSKQDGEIRAAPMFDINLYSHPPRFGDSVSVAFVFPAEPIEEFTCHVAGHTQTFGDYTLWHDLTLSLHQRELEEDKNWFVVNLAVVESPVVEPEGNVYARIHDQRSEEDWKASIEGDAQNPFSLIEYDTINETLTVELLTQ